MRYMALRALRRMEQLFTAPYRFIVGITARGYRQGPGVESDKIQYFVADFNFSACRHLATDSLTVRTGLCRKQSRSEERRVGKECRYRRSLYHLKKNINIM